jgi:hypothetical protein
MTILVVLPAISSCQNKSWRVGSQAKLIRNLCASITENTNRFLGKGLERLRLPSTLCPDRSPRPVGEGQQWQSSEHLIGLEIVTRSNVSRTGLGQLLEDRSNRVWLEIRPHQAPMAKERPKPGLVGVSGGGTDPTGRVNVYYMM